MKRILSGVVCVVVGAVTIEAIAEDFGMNAPVALPRVSESALMAKFPALSSSPGTSHSIAPSALLASMPVTSSLHGTSYGLQKSASFGTTSVLPSFQTNTHNSPVTSTMLSHFEPASSPLHANSWLQSGSSPSHNQMLVTPTTAFQRAY
jgi:hypothetical protein